MFEKLLSLLLHAKGGAVATVFVLGTTGALVTATVDAGVTTITITQPSSTTAGSETTPDGSTTNTTVTDTILALFNRTNTEEGTTEPATGGNGCSDEAHARNKEMKEVNEASKSHREEIKGLDRDADVSDAKQLVKDADKYLRDIRQAAVKAIHATFDCDPNEDEDDVDENDVDENDVDEDEDNTSATTDPSVAFGGDDAEAIADLAILAMDKVVADLKLALEGSEESTTTTNEKQNGKSDNAKNENKGNDNKGKGNGKGRSGGDEDDD